jgi:hypothetical protein
MYGSVCEDSAAQYRESEKCLILSPRSGGSTPQYLGEGVMPDYWRFGQIRTEDQAVDLCLEESMVETYNVTEEKRDHLIYVHHTGLK